jgi:hypothetical protein
VSLGVTFKVYFQLCSWCHKPGDAALCSTVQAACKHGCLLQPCRCAVGGVGSHAGATLCSEHSN